MSQKAKLNELQLAVVGELDNIFHHFHLHLGTQSHPLWRELHIRRVREHKERYEVNLLGWVSSPSLRKSGGAAPDLRFTARMEFGRTSFRTDALTPVSAVIRMPGAKPFRIVWSIFGEGADYRGGKGRVLGGSGYVPRVVHRPSP